MKRSDTPLVSCLCVTRRRVPFLKRAIACFEAQTYPNRELIVVVEDDDDETVSYMNSRKDKDRIRILLVQRAEGQRLGDLRNKAVESAKGEYICQWDDDDWYHRDRITDQLSAAVSNNKAGSILTHWIMYDVEFGKGYLSGERLWEGSILVRKSDLLTHNINYPSLARGEDNVFITTLSEKSLIHPFLAPALYIYTFHGMNTWDRGHFQYNFGVGKQLSAELSDKIGGILAGRLSDDEVMEVLASPELQDAGQN